MASYTAVAGLFAVLVLTPPEAPPQAVAPPTVTTRLSDDPFAGAWSQTALQETAEPLMKSVRAGGLAAGNAELEARLARTSDPVERSRLLTAYGIGLMSELDEGQGEGAGPALPFMQRAVVEGRAGFPADSRMLAMLLSDAASTEFMARGPETSATAEAWLEEAHRIRTVRLGPGSSETIASLVYLADIRGQSERVRGDPARIEAVNRLYEPLLTADPDGRLDDLTPFFIRWMTFLVQVDRPDQACAVLDKMAVLDPRLELDLESAAFRLGHLLSLAGHEDRARPLLADDASWFGPSAGSGKPPRCGS